MTDNPKRRVLTGSLVIVLARLALAAPVVFGKVAELRIIPHRVHGPLRWREFRHFGQVVPSGRNDDDRRESAVDGI